MLKPIGETDFSPENSRITRVEQIPAVNEKSRVNGVEKSRAERSIHTVFTASAPLRSPRHSSRSTTEFARPNFIPGAIKESEKILSIYPKIIAHAAISA